MVNGLLESTRARRQPLLASPAAKKSPHVLKAAIARTRGLQVSASAPAMNTVLKLAAERPPVARVAERPHPKRAVNSKFEKQGRSQRRQQQLVRLEKQAAAGLSWGSGALDDGAISKQVMKTYMSMLAEFWAYVDAENLSSTDDESFDQNARAFANYLFESEEHASQAELLRAAIEACEPRYGKNGNYRLPYLRRAIIGFQRLEPPRARWPTIEEALYLTCDGLLKSNSKEGPDVCVRAMASFSCYLRPSEATRLALNDVVDCAVVNGATGGLWEVARQPTTTMMDVTPTLLLSPFEKGMPTKNRKFDLTVAVDDKRMSQLPTVLALQVLRRRRSPECKNLKAAEVEAMPLFGVGQNRALKLLRQYAEPLGLKMFFETLYQLRHGGVTRDAGLKLREAPEIWRRGNWAQVSSVKHYEKQGRLASAKQMIRRDLLARSGEAQRRVWSRLLSS